MQHKNKAAMQRSDFDRLMERYLRGEVSEQEKLKIEAWLEVMATEDTADVELSPQDEDRIFRKLTSSVTGVKDVIALRPRKKLRPDQWMMRIAASLVIVCLLTYFGWDFMRAGENKLEVVAKNGVEKIILNDRSLVWLRGGSKLLFYEKPHDGMRYSTFDGEALFEVAKDPHHPFIMVCGEIKVKVLGTSFSIKTATDRVELTVLTGKVNLSSPSDAKGIDVLPLEKVVYKTTGEVKRIEATQPEITSITENTEYNMEFANDNLREVIQKIENKFNVKVKLSDKRIGNCRITADFTDSSLETTFQMISEVLGVDYSIDENTVTVSGKGCNQKDT
jgi:transmembrane sensor